MVVRVQSIAAAGVQPGPVAEADDFAATASQAEAETGSSTAVRNFTPQRVKQAAVAALTAANPVVLASDVLIYIATGAPVDYTDGDPAATGEGLAGIGSIYVRTDTGKLYLNGGTKAQPLWKLVTSA